MNIGIALPGFGIEPLAILGGLLSLALIWTAIRMIRLQREAATFRMVAEEANDGLLLQASDSRILWANRAYCRIFGYSRHELIGRYPLEFVLPPEDAVSPAEARSHHFDPDSIEFQQPVSRRNIRKNGEVFVNQYIQSVVRPGRSGRSDEMRVVFSCRDITEQVERETALRTAHETLAKVAKTDALTGLANRLFVQERLDDLFHSGTPFALLQLDLDSFKQINDGFGHAAGDAVLRNVAEILSDTAGPDWCCGRMGGDEFMLIIPEVTEFRAATRHALRILRRMRAPIPWGSGSLVCGGSVGIAIASPETPSIAALAHHADIALYSAKGCGRRRGRVACFDDRMARQHEEHELLRSALAAAIRNGEVDFHFHPVVSLSTGHVNGFETLARWSHPRFGAVPPSKFAPVIEELGLMPELDRLAARAALTAQRKICEAGFGNLRLGFNLSPGSFLSDDFSDFLIWEADRLGIRHCDVVVEVLETTFFGTDPDTDMPLTQIRKLRDAGFRTLLDDFGIGHAGLAHLAHVDVDGLKIDRTLTSRIDHDETARIIVESLVKLCRQLGLGVLGEGVETVAQLEILREIGCEYVQGFQLARPMSLERSMKFLEERDHPRAVSRRA